MEEEAVSKNHIRELYERYVGALAPWQIKLALARLKHFAVPLDRWEDAMQELAILIHRFRYDPDKAYAASEETILCRILDRRIKMLARSNARRQGLLDRFGLLAHPTEDMHLPEDDAMAVEVREAVAQLSPRRQQICRALMSGDNPCEVADRVGLHPETIWRNIAIIRETFREKGLDPWAE
jgi:DNA-binding CsgD family transcriptional regulator